VHYVQLSKEEFWSLWLKYLSVECFSLRHTNEKDAENENGLSLDPRNESAPTGTFAILHENVGWLEQLHAQYAPSRKMKQMFFEDHIRVCIIGCSHD
jgi:hypothetical protein